MGARIPPADPRSNDFIRVQQSPHSMNATHSPSSAAKAAKQTGFAYTPSIMCILHLEVQHCGVVDEVVVEDID
jgi:hypothetical protein